MGNLQELFTVYFRDTLGRSNWQQCVERRLNVSLKAIHNRFNFYTSPEGKKILEVGCGGGDMLIEIEKNDFAKEIVGLEPAFQWGKCARIRTHDKHTYVISGVGEKLPFSKNYFDIVFSYQVVEHVQDLEQFLSELVRVCRPGGDIYITGPNYIIPFEYHYQIWLLPWLPKQMSAYILRILGKNPEYLLCCISFVNPFQVWRIFKKFGFHQNINVIQSIFHSPQLISSVKIRKYVNLLNWIHWPSWFFYLFSPTFEMVIKKPL
jgi:2-polyprenyl-3-methyl-5-hydroxy-6-metoxy-1,4-benzoquinol methylase